MKGDTKQHFLIAKERGFKCAICQRKPPKATFFYDLSGTFCGTCFFCFVKPFFYILFIAIAMGLCSLTGWIISLF